MLAKKKYLKAFEQDIKSLYEAGKINSPIHLSGGNEDQLIDIFKDYNVGDWVFTTYRNHYHWILSGRNPIRLKKLILDNKSMHVYDKKFFVSSIVAGHIPIALGVSLALKLKNKQNRVLCFLGDSASHCGIYKECLEYATGHDLPITFIVEDNKYSVTTDTKKVWGEQKDNKEKRYEYDREYPHHGTGKYVLF